MVSVNKLASYQLHVLGLTSQFKEEPMLTMGMETYGYVVVDCQVFLFPFTNYSQS